MRCRVLCVVGGIVAWTIVIWTRAWWPVLFLWVLPSATLLNVFGRVRFTAEHIGVENEHELNFSRTVIPNWLERVFIAPFGINYHVEHHMFPSVPGWRLNELHKILMRDDSFSQRVHITRSYFGLRQGVFHELMSKVPQKSA
jgi:fatty acid desaturase